MFESASLSLVGLPNPSVSRVREIKKMFGPTNIAPCLRPSSENPMVSYWKVISKYPVLSFEDQDCLAKAYKEEGDEEASKILVLSNLRFSAKLSMKYSYNGINPVELMQEASVGLMEAVRRFDPERGVRFISYARFWIVQRVLSFLKGYHTISAKTRSSRVVFLSREKLRRDLEIEGKTLTPEEMSKGLKISPYDAVSFMTFVGQPLVRIDIEEGDILTPRSREENPEDSFIREELKHNLFSSIEKFSMLLEEREKSIFLFRTVAQEEVLTLSQLGKKFGLSKERVRQIESSTKKQFAGYLREKFGNCFFEGLFR